jgi:large subunit ribosomal protein L29
MDAREITKLSDEDILNAIEDNRAEMYQLRLQKANGELKNENLLRINRRNLARLKTVLNQRSAAAGSAKKGK